MKRHASAIFVGQVLEVRVATDVEFKRYLDRHLIRFRVEQYWKGIKTEEVIISGLGQLSCCNVQLNVGEKYLIYAVGKAMTTTCTRTMGIEHAADDMKALGPAKTF